MPARVSRRLRAGVFGRDPGAYARARLPYPARVYEVLARRCGLSAGPTVFEIGPGTGIATRELLRRGAGPMTLVEADRRMARYLRGSLSSRGDRFHILTVPFERASLPRASFDLGLAASSFHWLPERTALRRVARALRPGGWWATWNNLHLDPYRHDDFHDALQPLYRKLGPRAMRRSGAADTRAWAERDRRQRLRALRSVGRFDRVAREDIRWSVTLGTSRVRALWGTFSDVLVLPRRSRTWFLAELARVVDEEFGGKVRIPMLTPMYTARRL